MGKGCASTAAITPTVWGRSLPPRHPTCRRRWALWLREWKAELEQTQVLLM